MYVCVLSLYIYILYIIIIHSLYNLSTSKAKSLATDARTPANFTREAEARSAPVLCIESRAHFAPDLREILGGNRVRRC